MRLYLLFWVAATVAACAHEQTPVAQTTTTAATLPTTADAAIALLARQRCSHEAMCGHVGPAGRFASAEACDVATRKEERQSIGIAACPLGLDPDQLRMCLATLEAMPCSAAIPTVGEIADCRAFEMCRTP